MPRIRPSRLPRLRLNAGEFEAYLRGSHKHGSLDLHSKLDGRFLGGGPWTAVRGEIRLSLSVAARERGAMLQALRALATGLRHSAPRRRWKLAIRSGRRQLHGTLGNRRALSHRAGGSTPADRRLRQEMRALLLELPRDYGAQRQLAEQPEAALLHFAGMDVSLRECWLERRATARWHRLRAAAASDGVALQLVSGFRSKAYQTRIFLRKRARGIGLDAILHVNAAPGFSEHHTGRAVDLTTHGFAPVEQPFERSAAFAWLTAHADEFRLRMSYPRDNPHGILYEPWHWLFE
jgi:D-alanyl-D-alanine carboxypeptidase